MKDNENPVLNSTEAPAHPSQSVVDNSSYPATQFPQGSVTSRQAESMQQEQVPVAEETFKLPKRGLPKKPLLIGSVAILLFSIFGFLLLKLKPATPTLFGKKGEIVWWGIQHDSGVYAVLIDEFEKKN